MGLPVLFTETWTRLVVPEENAHVLRLLPSIRTGAAISQIFSLMGPIMPEGCSAKSGGSETRCVNRLVHRLVNRSWVENENALLVLRRKAVDTRSSSSFVMVHVDVVEAG